MPKRKPISKTFFADKYRELEKIAKIIQELFVVTDSNAKSIRGLLKQFSELHDAITRFSLTAEQESKLQVIREIAPKEKRRNLTRQLGALSTLNKTVDKLMLEAHAAAELCFNAVPAKSDELLRNYKAKCAELQVLFHRMAPNVLAPKVMELNQLSRRVNQSHADMIELKLLYKERTSAPFMQTLAIKQIQPMVTSYTAEELKDHKDLSEHAPEIAALQTFASEGKLLEYEEKLRELREAGIECRLTKGIVYLITQEDKTVEIDIKVQVKGHSLTWYFWAPGAMDQYPQSFRDVLYNQAAVCHRGVDDGCDLYYRGSNSVHIKLMHTHESESGNNHNHYRLKNNKSYTPHDFRQHMEGFIGSEIEKKYFQPGEIEEICNAFEEHYNEWTRKVEGATSKEERYFSDPTQLLNTGDMIELYLFGTMQEPCRLSAEELKVDYQKARNAIEERLKAAVHSTDLQATLEGELVKVESQYNAILEYRRRSGSRGLNSSIASSRQIEGSENPVVRKQQSMDDSLGVKDPGIPEWAIKLKEAVGKSQSEMIALAKQRHKVRMPPPSDDVVMEWVRDAGHTEIALFADAQVVTVEDAPKASGTDDDSVTGGLAPIASAPSQLGLFAKPTAAPGVAKSGKELDKEGEKPGVSNP